jgi:predicted NBD/HSP70 family sugar kinase
LVLQKATNRQTRLFNHQLVLRTIYDSAAVSRADVARLTGLTRTTVSELVEEHIADGLVTEIGTGPSTGGKAPILLSVRADARQLIGIDVGDSVLTGAVVNLRGEVREQVDLALDGRDGEQALQRIDGLVDQLMASADRPLLGIGLGTPGLIDTSTGTVRWAVNLDWRDLPLAQRLSDRYGLPAYVVNDSHAAALAEHTFGAHDVARSMLVVKVGRGIGAGIVINGGLFQGDGFGAGEMVASTRAVVQRARELAPHAPESALHAGGEIDFDALVRAFEAGDELAREVVLDAAHHLGRSIGALVGALNIERIVLVGAMAVFGEPWLAAVRREARRSSLALLADETRIDAGTLDQNLVVLGSAALLMTRELGLSLAR